MSREQHIARTFVELADTLVEDFDVIDFLHQMTVRCQELLDVTDAAVFLAHPGPLLHSPAPCDPSPSLQRVLDAACTEGPAVDAYRTTRSVAAADEAETAARWPEFAPQLQQAGYSLATALPMRLRQENIGSLLLLRTGSRPLNADDLALAQALADAATIGLIQARTIHQQHTVNEQLHTALQSRIIIEQAKGVLAARSNITLNTAFEALRHHARHHRIMLSDVAQDVIHNGLTPAPAPARSQAAAADPE
ncbi:ANTAR domain-containing protein [Streptomyces kunmingensis]|uniref:ANTAR domain-containing protein n=1 Tax=Streptomyces kunmingensis TaxID=68225 RepID=A0ABU6CE61_9ACTN|nr:ANTAR domain-containing protein [Streptomyces kunmingensis]MEB3962481.1 ANTAR domain-containing protein [Streptomyces kunmingensis]